MKSENKNNNITDFVLSIMLFLVSVANLFITNTYSKKMAIIIGCLILFTSLLLLIKNRNDKKYILLFGIILYINISIFISDILTNGSAVLSSNTLAWQKFRNTKYEMFFLNSLLIFVTIINLIDSISRRYIKTDEVRELLDNGKISKNKDNLLIFIICCIIILVGLITGYRNSSIDGNYLSATSTLYEYCIIFLLFAWYYAGGKKSRHIIIALLAIVYIVLAIIYGDRSSAFPMIMLMVILYFKKLSIPKLALVTIAGVLVANAVATYRESYTLSDFTNNYLARYGTMSFASDTVSQSYYTGSSIAYVRDTVEGPSQFFPDYLVGLIAGGEFGNANITGFAKEYATNKGGGMVVSDYYFWFGYYGVILEAIIIGVIIVRLRNEKNSFRSLWKICITVMVFRWYLYSSFVFFRSCIIVFLAVYCLFWMIDGIKRKRVQPVSDNELVIEGGDK